MARELGPLVSPGGRVIGVEPNARLRSIADERAGEQAEVEFLDGRAGALPFADGSVDVIWCERVLQHLHDPQAAIDDFARVLRPGGRAVLLDSDHATRITSDIDYAVEAKINTAFMAQVPNPHAARLIPRQAIQAGLTVDADVGSVGLVMPPEVLIDGAMAPDGRRACGHRRHDQPGRGRPGRAGRRRRGPGRVRLLRRHGLRFRGPESPSLTMRSRDAGPGDRRNAVTTMAETMMTRTSRAVTV